MWPRFLANWVQHSLFRTFLIHVSSSTIYSLLCCKPMCCLSRTLSFVFSEGAQWCRSVANLSFSAATVWKRKDLDGCCTNPYILSIGLRENYEADYCSSQCSPCTEISVPLLSYFWKFSNLQNKCIYLKNENVWNTVAGSYTCRVLSEINRYYLVKEYKNPNNKHCRGLVSNPKEMRAFESIISVYSWDMDLSWKPLASIHSLCSRGIPVRSGQAGPSGTTFLSMPLLIMSRLEPL